MLYLIDNVGIASFYETVIKKGKKGEEGKVRAWMWRRWFFSHHHHLRFVLCTLGME